MCKYKKKHRPNAHFRTAIVIPHGSEESPIRSGWRHLLGEVPPLRRQLCWGGRRSSPGSLLLLIHQTSAIFYCLLAARLSPRATRPRHPSISEAVSPDSGRWPTIGTALWSNQSRPCWWVVRASSSSSLTSDQSSDWRGHPCFSSASAGRGTIGGVGGVSLGPHWPTVCADTTCICSCTPRAFVCSG